MSHLLRLLIELTFLLNLGENKEGDKISIRFFLLLYSVVTELGVKSFFVSVKNRYLF